MKLLVVGGSIGFVIGASITLLYFSIKTLVSANAKVGRSQPNAMNLPEPEELSESAASKSRGVGV